MRQTKLNNDCHKQRIEPENIIVLVHNVYFTLKDPTPAAIQHLMAECRKYLSDHPGVAYFWCWHVGA